MVLLYATIWVALVTLLLGELGRRRHRQTGIHTRWATIASAIGVTLTSAHMLLALAVVYDWDHARAAAVTSQRASAIYGAFAGPSSLYVNYVFLAWWAADTAWWWRRPGSFIRRAGTVEWAWRMFVLTMVVNGAVIFASPAGRLAGIPLTAAFLFIWANDRRFTRSS